MSRARLPELLLPAAVLCACAFVASCGSEPASAPEAPPEASRLSDEEVERLRSLGYVDVVGGEDATLPGGLLRHDPSRSQAGL